MKGTDLNKILIIGGVALIITIAVWLFSVFGSMDDQGCLLRYSDDNNNNSHYNFTLKSTGNYDLITKSDGSLIPDPNGYGKWKKTNIFIKNSDNLEIKIKGEVSLCKSYLPANNLQQNNQKNSKNQLIEVPRVDDGSKEPLKLVFSTKNDSWRNLLELYQGDKLDIRLLPDQKNKEQVFIKNIFDPSLEFQADCRDGKTKYSPICGRFATHQRYLSDCKAASDQCNIDSEFYIYRTYKVCPDGTEETWNCNPKIGADGPCGKKGLLKWSCYAKIDKTEYRHCYDANSDIYKNIPAYQADGKYTVSWREDLNYFNDMPKSCSNRSDRYKVKDFDRKFWFSANDASGLIYRFNDDINIDKSRGNDFQVAKIINETNPRAEGKLIMQKPQFNGNIRYLQYRFFPDNIDVNNNSGGYVFSVRHSKCYRSNGNSNTDIIEGRGAIQYMILPIGTNPNDDEGNNADILKIDNNGVGAIENNDKAGYLWMRIFNKKEDYKNSVGEYMVDVTKITKSYDFYNNVMKPLISFFKENVQNISINIFKNLTCYKSGSSQECINFFNYIKILLVIYISFLGISFLSGNKKMNQSDFIIIIAKISIIAALVNGKLFEFFNRDVINTLYGLTDEIIANIGGFTARGGGYITNPFMFLNDLMNKIFFDQTFAAQILATISFGLVGLIYFCIILISLIIFIIAVLQSITIYIMSFMAISVLIGLAPIFLIFIMFESTWHLFDNWVKMLLNYIIEPVISLIGIIIFVELFMLILDMMLNYSVCYKCAISFKIPFLNAVGLGDNAFLNTPIFCLKWFAPWGFDPSNSSGGMSMTAIAMSLMISYSAWKYNEFAEKFTGKIMSYSAGGASGASIARGLNSAVSNSILKRFGLDKKSRASLKHDFNKRMASMKSSMKNKRLEVAENRYDIDRSSKDNKLTKDGDDEKPNNKRNKLLNINDDERKHQEDQGSAIRKMFGDEEYDVTGDDLNRLFDNEKNIKKNQDEKENKDNKDDNKGEEK